MIDDFAQSMYARDASAAALGIELVEASPHGAVVTMPVTESMCNGFQLMHGGMTFLLADSAMAFASNSECTPGEQALAASAEIDWLAPVAVGEQLTATATRRHGEGRSVVWDVEVATAEGTPVAIFRGRTRRIGER
ncbi:MAG TPA: hotdog fold thioesterase [Ilumatobacter sp.]|nr:hotdog fold thioesterase [Ilumatobacter sp.]